MKMTEETYTALREYYEKKEYLQKVGENINRDSERPYKGYYT